MVGKVVSPSADGVLLSISEAQREQQVRFTAKHWHSPSSLPVDLPLPHLPHLG